MFSYLPVNQSVQLRELVAPRLSGSQKKQVGAAFVHQNAEQTLVLMFSYSFLSTWTSHCAVVWITRKLHHLKRREAECNTACQTFRVQDILAVGLLMIDLCIVKLQSVPLSVLSGPFQCVLHCAHYSDLHWKSLAIGGACSSTSI